MKTIRELDVIIGLYDTSATLIRHRDGTATLRMPYVKWIGSTGTLAFEKTHITEEHVLRALKEEVFVGQPKMGYAEFVDYYINV